LGDIAQNKLAIPAIPASLGVCFYSHDKTFTSSTLRTWRNSTMIKLEQFMCYEIQRVSNRKNSRAAYNLIQEIIYALDTMSQSSQIEDGSNLEGEALQEWLDNYELNL